MENYMMLQTLRETREYPLLSIYDLPSASPSNSPDHFPTIQTYITNYPNNIKKGKGIESLL
jgi:hypothetical protein